MLETKALAGEIDVEYFDESGFNLNVLGFFNKNKSTLFASTSYDKVDTEVVIGHFNLFVDEISKPTVAVVDNASIHTSKKFKEMILKWEEKGLSIFYLPPYSPQLNPIEMVWKFMKYYWIEFDAYLSIENMKNYVEKVMMGYGVDFKIKFV